MTDPADRLAETARKHDGLCGDQPDWLLTAALAAWDADTERRQAEQDIIERHTRGPAMTPGDTLAACVHYGIDWGLVRGDVADDWGAALDAYEADRERRQAEQFVVEALIEYQAIIVDGFSDGEADECILCGLGICTAVRRLRQLDQ